MITPRFSLSQDSLFVIIRIHAPQASPEDVEYRLDGETFVFTSKPYYLRLTLPGEVEENDLMEDLFDSEAQDFIIKAPKVKQGEAFPNLQLISELLRVPVSQNGHKVGANIEILNETVSNDSIMVEEDEAEFDWFIEQTVPPTEEEIATRNPFGFGFAGKSRGDIQPILDELGDLIDVSEPGRKNPLERRHDKEDHERARFSDDHYLADYFAQRDGKELQRFLDMVQPPIYGTGADTLGGFTEKDQDALKDLPRLEYLLSGSSELQAVALGLADLLFAAAYDSRMTDGEGTCESAWTIVKVSATLSAFELKKAFVAVLYVPRGLQSFNSVPELLRSCFRRALVYPLYRHFQLAQKAQEDVAVLLEAGPVSIVQVLLKIRQLFIERESFYVFNNLFLHHYIIFVQRESPKVFQKLAAALKTAVVKKEDLDFAIPELEAAALSVLEEENSEEELVCGESEGLLSRESGTEPTREELEGLWSLFHEMRLVPQKRKLSEEEREVEDKLCRTSLGGKIHSLFEKVEREKEASGKLDSDDDEVEEDVMENVQMRNS